MKVIKFVVFYSVLACVAFLFGCRSDSAINGVDFGSVESVTILTSIQATYDDTVSSTGRSQFLEIGQLNNIRTYSLLKFDSISDSANILSAKLILNTNTLFSEGDNKSMFTATVHQISEDWQETTVKYETLPGFEQSPLSSTTIISAAASASGADSLFTETITFEFDNVGVALIESWKDTLNSNFGFFLNHENSNFIKEFFSENSSINQPRLELEIENLKGRDTVLVVASEGAFIVEQLSSFSNGPLYVDNLFSNATVLKFDLSALQKETVVNSAVLKLNFIEDISILKASGFSFRVDLLSQPYTGKDSVKIDSTFTPILDIVNPSANPVTISMNRVLQFWLTEDFENHGILIRAFSPGSDVSKAAFHSNTTDISVAPRMEAIVSSISLEN